MKSEFLKKINKVQTQTEKELQRIGKILLTKLKPPPNPYALFHHEGHCLSRVRDIARLLIRMHRNSLSLIKVSYVLERARSKNHPSQKRLWKKQHDLTEYMKIDYESIFLFGDIMLDQWALTVAYLMGFSNPEEFSFYKLIGQIEKEGEKSRLSKLWSQKKSQMIWLDSHIRIYRNRFITHVDRPWQRGMTHSTYGDSFALFTPSPPGWIDDEEFKREIHPLKRLLPGYNEGSPYDYWLRRRPLTQLEYLFRNIGSIESKKDREEIQRLMSKYGGATPDYKETGLNLLSFIAEATPLVIEETINHLKKVNLGEPKKVR